MLHKLYDVGVREGTIKAVSVAGVYVLFLTEHQSLNKFDKITTHMIWTTPLPPEKNFWIRPWVQW